jgi:hypothetical protein
MRALVLASVAVWFASAVVSYVRADEPLLGRPVEGVTVTLEADGKIAFRPSDLVVLEDGRELRRIQGDQFRLLSKNDASAAPADISGLDFLLQASELIGHRVRVTGGVLLGADVDRAQLALKGGTVFVQFAGAARDAVRQIVVNCAGFTRNEAKCGYNVVGTVKESSLGKPQLIDLVLEPRAKPPNPKLVGGRPRP